MWVARAEPSRHSTGVGASNDKDFDAIRIHLSDEVGKIRKSLLRVQVLEGIKAPVIEGLRISVEAMLEYHELGVVLRRNHERI